MAALASARYIVGTPWKTVTPSATISSIAAAASKRGSRTSVAPCLQIVFMLTVCPKVWNSGSAPSATSPGCRSCASNALTVAFITRLR